MSLKQTKKVIQDFLLNKDPEVLSIRGDWGVGKTYFWNEAIKGAKNDHKFCRGQYSYVSLFGMESLAQLKTTIFENIVDAAHIGTDFSIEKSGKEWSRRSLRLLSVFPKLKDAGSLAYSIAFHSVTDTLICVDDLERKGNSLSLKELLGLLRLLRDERNCKIALIFSDAKLDEGTAKDYAEFREKVIDVEVPFSPAAEESAALVFKPTGIEAQLSAFTNKLDISNIRILKRIRHAAYKTVPFLQDFDPLVTHKALQTLALFGRCFHSKDSRFPPYKYVKTYGFHLGKKETPEEQEWEAFLRKYEFRETDELDIALSFIIENGYVDEENLKAQATIVNQRVLATRSQDALNDAWTLYHDSFQNNEEEVANAFVDSFKKYVAYVGPSNLNGVVSLLRELKRDALASELIDFFIDAHREYPEMFELSRHSLLLPNPDQELANKFETKRASFREVSTIESVLTHVAEHHRLEEADEALLASATPDDFYRIFKAARGKSLHSFVEASLMFERGGDPTDRQKRITANAKEALLKIGSESLLNKVRVTRYGVYRDDKTT